jgi:dihydroxyacetone kinase-like predicted kinase
MGRTFKSVRMGSQEVAQRWLKASRALNKDDQIYGQRLAEMIKKHSSEAFYALDDPLEAAIFSVLVEFLKETDRKAVEKREDVDL